MWNIYVRGSTDTIKLKFPVIINHDYPLYNGLVAASVWLDEFGPISSDDDPPISLPPPIREYNVKVRIVNRRRGEPSPIDEWD